MINLVYRGRVYSKKNSRRVFKVWSAKARRFKRISVPSEAYERMEPEIICELSKQLGPHFVAITDPIRLTTVFYYKGNQDVDADNLHTSICDVLQKGGFIINDKIIYSHRTDKIIKAPFWAVQIQIEPVDISDHIYAKRIKRQSNDTQA